jgi:hypothetical protein
LGKIAGNAFQPALFHILHPPARFADKVVMMSLIGAEKIILLAVGQENPGDYPGFGQFVEDAIDRGEADTADSGLDAVPDLLGGKIGQFSSQAVHDLLPAGSYFEF